MEIVRNWFLNSIHTFNIFELRSILIKVQRREREKEKDYLKEYYL